VARCQISFHTWHITRSFCYETHETSADITVNPRCIACISCCHASRISNVRQQTSCQHPCNFCHSNRIIPSCHLSHIYKLQDVRDSEQSQRSDRNDCRESEQKLLGGSSASSSDPDLASLDIEEEAGGGIHDTLQDGAVATDNPPDVQAQAQVGGKFKVGALSHHSACACLHCPVPMQTLAVLEREKHGTAVIGHSG